MTTIETISDAAALVPDAERVQDPEYIHARLQDILDAAQRAGASAPSGFRDLWEKSSLKAGLGFLAADMRLFGRAGDECLAALCEQAPTLTWACSSRFFAYGDSAEEAEQAAAALGLAEKARTFDNRRVWDGERAGFEVRIYGPQEADR